jgi:hypothetical protein
MPQYDPTKQTSEKLTAKELRQRTLAELEKLSDEDFVDVLLFQNLGVAYSIFDHRKHFVKGSADGNFELVTYAEIPDDSATK